MKKTELKLWRWQVLEPDGALKQGFSLAYDRSTVLQEFAQRNAVPIAIRQLSFSPRRSWSLRNKIDFLRQLAALVHAGLSLDYGCRILAEQHPLPVWRALLEQVARQLEQGQPLSAILEQWPVVFPPLFIALLRTGELTGKLDVCCHQLAAQQEQQYLLHKKVMKALRYPLFTLLIALLVSGAMLIFVLPEFASIYQSFNAPLPALTRHIITLSGWLERNAPWCIVLIAFITTGWVRLRRMPGWQSREQRLLLKLPLLAELVRGQRLSQIHTTLALTQQSGIPLLQGLEAAEMAMAHPWWQAKLCDMGKYISTGGTFSQALNQAGVFTPFCIQLARTGEESGSLDIMLGRLAQWHAERTHERADGLTAALEPIMMIVTGAIIGTLVIALYLPIFQLGDAMSMG
ncbi:protein transport protein HofC [Enterobacteriaceae bacterium 4M9]|nr:protein transport protein HofC [Enterobacteriaceae bacterium 4M9]